jgi:antitoxin VapB
MITSKISGHCNFIYTDIQCIYIHRRKSIMAIHLREPAADAAVRRLAAAMGVGLTEAIRISAENELKRIAENKTSLEARIGRIQKRAKSFARSGLKADKAFYDDLSGNL